MDAYFSLKRNKRTDSRQPDKTGIERKQTSKNMFENMDKGSSDVIECLVDSAPLQLLQQLGHWTRQLFLKVLIFTTCFHIGLPAMFGFLSDKLARSIMMKVKHVIHYKCTY